MYIIETPYNQWGTYEVESLSEAKRVIQQLVLDGCEPVEDITLLKREGGQFELVSQDSWIGDIETPGPGRLPKVRIPL